MDDATKPMLPAALLGIWAGVLVLAATIGVGLSVQGVDYPTPFAIAQAYRLLVGAELFFVLVAAPLIAGRGGLLAPVLLLAIAAPAVVVVSWVAACEWPQILASQAYLVVAAAFAASYGRADASGRFRGWYWLALGAFGAGAPLLAFVGEDVLRVRLGWLYALSPFWVADRLSRSWEFAWAWAVPSAVLLLVAVALWRVARGAPRD